MFSDVCSYLDPRRLFPKLVEKMGDSVMLEAPLGVRIISMRPPLALPELPPPPSRPPPIT